MNMVTTKKSTTHTPKRSSSTKKSVTHSRAKKTSEKVDFYPNRMTYAVSAAAGAILVLIAVVIAYS
jgi:uncharacterized membrane protein YkgB